jgi:hypothetical protein
MMWHEFKRWPLSVQAAVVFLFVTITSVVVMVPAVMIPLLILIATIASIIRVLAFFIHGD